MNIVNDFKDYLFSQKKPSGALTIKNYVADVNKFINWYERTYTSPFTPDCLKREIIKQYQAEIQHTGSSQAATNSVKRYFSSLRKFTSYLIERQLLTTNPFIEYESKQVTLDPYYLNAFKGFLSGDRASKLTVKNYINDVKQFLEWLEKVTENSNQPQSSNLLDAIDNKVLEEYKMRLLNEAKLSPVSINRKLSSLRRYMRWLQDRKILTKKALEPTEPIVQAPPITSQFDLPMTNHDLPLTALQSLNQDTNVQQKTTSSAFAPIRLAQKSINIINLSLDLLIVNPIAYAAGSIQYLVWKNGKKIIFAPVIDIVQGTTTATNGIAIKTIIPKQFNLIPPRTANPALVIQKIAQYNFSNNPFMVRNFTKSLYAPLSVSTEQMHWMGKLWLTLRYKRPQWYKKYHSYAIANHLHFAIMVIAMTIAGSAVYQTWASGDGVSHEAVLAAQDTSPPRTLTFQGQLKDNTSTPITVETPLRFTLYNSPTATGAATLWQENQDITPDHNGKFVATLGLKKRLDQDIFKDNSALYIGIAIGDNPELMPRQQIPTSNYAADSQTVEGMKPITDTPDKPQNVLLALDSSGNLTIGGTASHTFQATGGQINFSGQALLLTTNPGSNGNIQLSPDGSGIIDIRGPIQNTSNNVNSNGVTGAVDIEDILSISTSSSSQSALVINQNGSGDIISARSKGSDKFRLDNGGNAFIGGNIILKGDTIDSTSTAFDIGGDSVKHLTIGSKATVLSLGDITGTTTIKNNLTVNGSTTLTGTVTAAGLITADGGITISKGQTLAFADFTPGGITFIGGNSQMQQDATNFSWNDTNKTLNVLGSLCVNSVAGGTCDSTAGTITVKNNLNIQSSADLAENYISSESLEPGDVVVAEGGKNPMAIIKSSIPYDKKLIGIVSTKPGITLNSEADPDYEHPNVYPLALQGRVPIKVSSINGPIKPGDELTSSAIPGVSMLASASGQTIGKALESYDNADPKAVGKIMAFVNLTYYSSPATITSDGTVILASKVETNQTTKLNLEPENDATASAMATPASTTSAQMNQNSVTASPSAYIYNSIASPSAQASGSADTSETPTPTPTIEANLQTNAALPSDFANLNQSSDKLTYVPNLKSDTAMFSNGLIALGPSSLTDVAVSDLLVIHNNLKITSDSIDTIASDLNIQPLRQGNILLQGGLVAIDTEGNLKVNGNANFAQNVNVNGQLAAGIIAPVPNHDLTVSLDNKSKSGSNMIINNATGNHVVQINQQGDIIASGQAQFNSIASQGFAIIRGVEADASNTITVADGSGGKGIISAHQTERTIITPYVTTHSLIYVTATSNAGSSQPYVARQTPEDPNGGTKGAFTVEIPAGVSHDISFNWWIVN